MSAGKVICRNDQRYGGFPENVVRRLGLTSGKGWVLKLNECKYACPGKGVRGQGHFGEEDLVP